MAHNYSKVPEDFEWCMSYREWVDKYKPIEEGMDFLPKDVEPNRVWSEVSCDGVQTIIPGSHFINVTGYTLTEVPHDEKTPWVFVSEWGEDVYEEEDTE